MKKHSKNYKKLIWKRRIFISSVIVITILIILLIMFIIKSIKKNNKMPQNDESTISQDVSQTNSDDKSIENTALIDEEKKQYVTQHKEEYSEDLIEFMGKYDQVIDYVYNYKFKDKLDKNSTSPESISQNGIPLLIQWDSRWGYEEYCGSLIGMTGCGPTCLTMVYNGLTNSNKQSVVSVCKICSQDKNYTTGTGTNWALLTSTANTMGMQSKVVSLSFGAIKTELDKGHPIICNVSKGYFTTGGHYIVTAGIKDGKLIINDPNSKENSSKLWDLDDISSQIKNLWSFWI